MSKWKQLLLVVGVFFMTSTHAQNQALACQDDVGAGLKWENGRWNRYGFVEKKFILVMNGTDLDKDSVGKVILSNQHTQCQKVYKGKIACFSQFGSFLFFDPSTMKGAKSHHFGATLTDLNHRDTLLIHAFTCQPF